jgi:hypothetical protein
MFKMFHMSSNYQYINTLSVEAKVGIMHKLRMRS